MPTQIWIFPPLNKMTSYGAILEQSFTASLVFSDPIKQRPYCLWGLQCVTILLAVRDIDLYDRILKQNKDVFGGGEQGLWSYWFYPGKN